MSEALEPKDHTVSRNKLLTIARSTRQNKLDGDDPAVVGQYLELRRSKLSQQVGLKAVGWTPQNVELPPGALIDMAGEVFIANGPLTVRVIEINTVCSLIEINGVGLATVPNCYLATAVGIGETIEEVHEGVRDAAAPVLSDPGVLAPA